MSHRCPLTPGRICELIEDGDGSRGPRHSACSGPWRPASPSIRSWGRRARPSPKPARGLRGSRARPSPCRGAGIAEKIASGDNLRRRTARTALADAPSRPAARRSRRPESRGRRRRAESRSALPTVAELAAERLRRRLAGPDRRTVRRLGRRAISTKVRRFWAAPRGKSAYAAWRAVAMHDLTPEIAGLPGFAPARLARRPTPPSAAIGRARRAARPRRGGASKPISTRC